MNAILSLLAGPIGSVLTPALTVLIGKGLLNVRPHIDALSVPAKQGVVVVIAGVLTAAQSALGADICGGQPCSLETLAVPSLASAAIAYILHAVVKLRKQA